jgi:hypothetical protein
MGDIVTTAEELLHFVPEYPELAGREPNALHYDGYFVDAMLSDVRVNSVGSSVGALIDMRGALAREGPRGPQGPLVAVLVFTGVSDVRWAARRRVRQRWIWQEIAISRLTPGDNGITAEIICALWENDEDELVVVAGDARLYEGNMPQLDSAPPDMGRDTDVEVYRGLAGWSSPMTVERYWAWGRT